MARFNADGSLLNLFGAARRDWAPAFAGEQICRGTDLKAGKVS
jgi:hypothetical protein